MTRPERASRTAFVAVSALLFAGSAAVTIAWCVSMADMDGMQMPGGWTMSMAWMRMPGQTWLDAAASFLAMWVVMMVAMMLPSVAPMLWRYRNAVRSVPLTVLAAIAYFFVWTVIGLVAFPVGVALAAVEMRSPALASAVPIAAAVVVLIAGAVQLTAWKARRLACCAQGPARALRAEPSTAWRHGLRLGLRCSACCANLTAILFAIGVMDPWAMAIVTVAITLERLAPAHLHIARVIGGVAVAGGLALIAQAVAL